MPSPILETRNLSKRYGEFSANTDINLSINSGTIHGIIGPNGAGKTTLFNCLAGTIPMTFGSILFDKKEIGNLTQHTRPLMGIGRSFQVTNLFSDLSVFENLRLAGQALKSGSGFVFWHPIRKQEELSIKIRDVLLRIALLEAKDSLVCELSHGEQRLMEVGMALMARPKLLLLDEPTSGMGIDDVPKMTSLLKTLREECTVVLIEHNVGLVVEVCDKVTVMQAGKIIAEGTPEEISANDAVKAAYLGETY